MPEIAQIIKLTYGKANRTVKFKKNKIDSI